MADKKVGDLSIALVIGVFVLGVFIYAISDMDANTSNSEDLVSRLSSGYRNVNSSVNSMVFGSKGLESNTFGGNGSSMTILQNQFIDTRGTGQGNIISKDSKSTFIQFINDATDLTKWDYHGVIAKLFISLITIVTVVLLIRLFLGSYRI